MVSVTYRSNEDPLEKSSEEQAALDETSNNSEKCIEMEQEQKQNFIIDLANARKDYEAWF